MRAMWLHCSSPYNDINFSSLPFSPIICISVSREQLDDDRFYIQGAADDEENWSLGLTPDLFWIFKDFLLESESETESRVLEIVKRSRDNPLSFSNELQQKEPNMKHWSFIGNTRIAFGSDIEGTKKEIFSHFDVVINCSSTNYPDLETIKNYLFSSILSHNKSDKWKISRVLPSILDLVSPKLDENCNILIHSINDVRITICIALAILILKIDEKGNILKQHRTQFSKSIIRTMYLFLQNYCSSEIRPTQKHLHDIHRFYLTPTYLCPTYLTTFRSQWNLSET